MLIFVIRRVLISIPVLIASTILTFILVKFSGDPLGYQKENPRVSPETIRAHEQMLYLDRSWPAQYWHWISNVVLHFDFGPQVRATQQIRPQLFSALGVTLKLVLVTVVLALVLAVLSGVLSAVKQYSVLDYSVTLVGFVFLSIPTVFFAALLKQGAIEINRGTETQAFGTIGDRTIPNPTGFLPNVGDTLSHTILPVLTLSLISYAAWSRFTRASMLEVLNSDYVRLARSKGLSRRRVLVRHALRTALIPLTTVTALDAAALLGGAIITESIFQWRGMGDLFLRAVRNTDFNVMLAWLLVAAVLVILFNLIADLLYGVLDPRIRHA